jgi:hypothetical protein
MRYGDNGLTVDFGRMAEAIDESDVLVVGFEMTSKRLLIDLRADDHSPPLVEVVDPLANAQQRNEWLDERRPGVPQPEHVVFFVWPHSMELLNESPLFSRSRERILKEQGVDVSADIEDVRRDLERRERDDTQRALAGSEGYRTLWRRADR